MVNRDTIAGVVVFTFSLTAFILSYNYRGGAEIFPRLVSGIMLVCSAILIARSIIWPTHGQALTAGERRRIALSIALTLGYIVAIVPLGFLTASLIHIPLTAYVLGMRQHVMIWVTTLLFLVTIYYVFDRFFYTPLPRELIFRLIG
jgi:hypothetical protein